MSKNRSICKRCHRIRVVNDTRYCEACAAQLRADERRRPHQVTGEAQGLATSAPFSIENK